MGKKSRLKRERKKLMQQNTIAKLVDTNNENIISYESGPTNISIGPRIRMMFSNVKSTKSIGSGFDIHKDADVIFDTCEAYGNCSEGVNISDYENNNPNTEKGENVSIKFIDSEFYDNGGNGVSVAHNTKVEVVRTKAYRNAKDGFVERDDKYFPLYTAIEQMRNITNEFRLSDSDEEELLTNIIIIEENIKSKNPEVRKIEMACLSVQRILEMVTASAIYANSPSIATVINLFKTGMEASGF